MRLLIALLSGMIFGIGLTLSGMTDTAKVQNWLDLFGNWDPTLAFVLGGAILPMLIAWRVAEKRTTSVLGTVIPKRPDPVIDTRLLVGSAFFGVGWALAGLCPGPAVAVLGFGGWDAAVFFIAMLVGMIGHRFIFAGTRAPLTTGGSTG